MSYQINILSPHSSPPSRQDKAFLHPDNQKYEKYPQTIKKTEKNPIAYQTQRKRPDYPSDSLSYLENELDGGRGWRREGKEERRENGGDSLERRGGRTEEGRFLGRRREEDEKRNREEEYEMRMEVERKRKEEIEERDAERIREGEGGRNDKPRSEIDRNQYKGQRWEDEREGRWEEGGEKWEEGGRKKDEGGGSLSTKQRYAEELKQQMMAKDIEKQRNKLREQVLENKLLADNDQWFGRQGGGAPIRDFYGQVAATRGRPKDPNTMSEQLPSIRSPATKSTLINIGSESIPPQLSVLPNDNTAQPSYFPSPPPSDINKLFRRERELEAQRENLQMILSKERSKQDVKRRKKEEEEEEWRRVEREREEQNRRRMWEFKNVDLESRNLNETNFDFGRYNEKIARLNKRGKRKDEEGGGREGVGTDVRGERRQRTPVQYAERELKELKERETALLLQKKIMDELPKEVSKTVQSTMDIEIQKIKNELNFQQNILGEQILNLKGQLLQSNDERYQSQKEINRLHQEIQKTQMIDEIRQRELYAALVMKSRPGKTIFHSTTERLNSPQPISFTFPKRPKPYYNIYDPSIEDFEFRNKDIHSILNHETQLLLPNGPPSGEEGNFRKNKRFSMSDPLKSNMVPFEYRQTNQLSSDFPSLPEDYLNMQSLSHPLKYPEIDSDYLGLYKKNTEKLEQLEEKVEKQKNSMKYEENSGYWNNLGKNGNKRNFSISNGYKGDGTISNYSPEKLKYSLGKENNVNSYSVSNGGGGYGMASSMFNDSNYYSPSKEGVNNEENNYFYWKDEEKFKSSLLATGKWEDGEEGEQRGELEKLDRKLFDTLERREDRALVLSSEELMKQMNSPWEYQSSSWEF